MIYNIRTKKIRKMKVTEEMAKLLDTILSTATEKQRIVTLSDTNENKDMYITLGHILEQYNLGKWLGGSAFMVFPEGLVFIQNDSFLERFKQTNKELTEEKEIKQLNFQLTQQQLSEIKRNRHLSVASIIIAIFALVISLLQFLKS
jgi:hypothetical protein